MPSEKGICNMLSFAAGVMLSISFIELIPESILISPVIIVMLGTLFGFSLMFILDKKMPHINPESCSNEPDRQIRKTALFLITGMFLHNFPEGMAIATGTISNFKLSLSIALAIAIHDIPEGLCTSSTYFKYSKKRWKSFILSAITSIPTIIGFFIAYYLYKWITPAMTGFVMSATAGFMVYLTIEELLPFSCTKKPNTLPLFFFLFGLLSVIALQVL